MKTRITLALRWSLGCLAVGLVLPSLIVFCLEVFVGGVNPATSLGNVAAGGLLAIAIPVVIGQVSVWYPLYGPGDMSSTAVIGLFFLPLIGLATLPVGLLLGWLLSLVPWFRGSGGAGQLRG